MYMTDYIKTFYTCIHILPPRTRGRRGFGGNGFDLGFFVGLLHSPLGNLGRFCCSLHPPLQVGSRSLRLSLQVDPSQLLLLLLLGGYDGRNVFLL